MSIYEVEHRKFNEKLAEALKQIPEFKMPEWAVFVKTSVHKERPPQDEDFWYKRAASILRQLYIHEIVGVNRLKTRYGGKKDRGARKSKFRKASGKMIRTILQQAEKAGFAEQAKEKRSGRRLTDYGKKFLDEIAEQNKEMKAKEEK